jgi:hypothetical protein
VKAQQTVDAIWTQMKPLAETLRDKLAGPAAVVNGRARATQSNGVAPLTDTPEARAQAVAAMGIAI